MFLYSLLMAVVLVVGAPWWLWRMATSGRYRAGLGERLGRVPARLRNAAAGRPTVWVHAVSVGEVLAAARLISELEAARPDLAVLLSTTTRTGQELAAKKLGPDRVFYFPLDFAFAVRRYLNALQPRLLVLMESELWPRLLVEASRRNIPIAVVNGRISDRSLPRYHALRRLWRPLLRRVSLLLTQDAEDARRFVQIGALPERVDVIGNLKYDVRASPPTPIVGLIREAAAARPILIAGSTVGAEKKEALDEDQLVIQAWSGVVREKFHALLVLAPRHPQRFAEAHSLALEFPTLLASEMLAGKTANQASSSRLRTDEQTLVEIVVLDTIGDLAGLYRIADTAFVGGSLVPAGGHNPLEPAQFAVPVVMGPSYENFRGIVKKMRDSDGIRVVSRRENLETAWMEMLTDRETARALGERGRAVYAAESGATRRAVQALLALLKAPV